MVILMVLVCIGLIALAVWGVGQLFPTQNRTRSLEDASGPLEVLARRYARGDISGQEYEAIRKDIETASGDGA